jgi:hypothetical protein
MAEDKQISERIRRLSRQVVNYSSLVFWFLRDLFAHLRWQSLRLVLTSSAQLGSRYGAMGVLYYCIRAFEGTSPPVVLGYQLPGREFPAILVFGMVLASLLLALAAGFRYSLQNKTIRIATDYNEFCLRRLLMLIGRLPDARAPEASLEVVSGRVMGLMASARQSRLLTKQIGRGMPSVAGLIIGVALLLAIDFDLTASIALVTLVVLAALYPANRRAAKASGVFQEYSRRANVTLKSVVLKLQSAPVPLEENSPILNRLFSEGSVPKAVKGYSNRLRAVEQAVLTTEIGGIAMIGTGLAVLGAEIATGESTFAHAVLYFGVIRYVLRDFVRASKLFASINRFYAQIMPYVSFVRKTRMVLDESAAAHRDPSEPVTFALPAVDDHKKELVAAGGSFLALVAPENAQVSVSGMVSSALDAASGSGMLPALQINGQLLDGEVPLRASLALSDKVDPRDLAETLKSFAPRNAELEWTSGKWLDRFPKGSWQEDLPRWAVAGLQVLAGKSRGNQIVLIEESLFDQMSERWQAELLAQLADRILIMVHRSTRNLGNYGESTAILCDYESARLWVGLSGEETQREMVEETYRRLIEQMKERVDFGADMEDELEFE